VAMKKILSTNIKDGRSLVLLIIRNLYELRSLKEKSNGNGHCKNILMGNIA